MLGSNGLAVKGYGDLLPGGYSLQSGLEVVLTLGFLIVIPGSIDTRSPSGFAPIAIGLAPKQLWLFRVAPIVGAFFAGHIYRVVAGNLPAPAVTGEPI